MKSATMKYGFFLIKYLMKSATMRYLVFGAIFHKICIQEILLSGVIFHEICNHIDIVISVKYVSLSNLQPQNIAILVQYLMKYATMRYRILGIYIYIYIYKYDILDSGQTPHII